MNGCSFCAIVRGEGTVHAVFETADVLAFFPLASAAVGHTLVIPKTHIPDIWSLVDSQASSLMISTLSVARAIRQALRPDGMNVINSNGAAASQSVRHLHIHLVPRWSNDSFGVIWPASKPIADEVKDETARLIRGCVHKGP
jgi:diadenosine tetraphosphate (Ap4A) HIT family hydrolase